MADTRPRVSIIGLGRLSASMVAAIASRGEVIGVDVEVIPVRWDPIGGLARRR